MSAVYRMNKQTKEQQIRQLLKALLNDDEAIENPKYMIHKEAIEPWKLAMRSGTMTGRVFSHHTVRNYERYVVEFFTNHSILSFENFRTEIEQIAPESFGRRDKYFKGIISFAKFLIREKSLAASFLDQSMKIKPKRHIPARQTSITEDQLKLLMTACRTPLETLIITFLATTGLRASEFCHLKLEDIDLENGKVTVQRGKGGKRRKVGLTHECLEMLSRHIQVLPQQNPNDYIFLDILGKRMERDGLLHRISRIGKRVGLTVSPHVLRRAFVTHNANKGRSIVMLQIACGHSDIKTTRSYCKTSEDEVIQAMKDW